jgi:predicted DsbA family dithiol-disulfide isomerase
MLDVGAGTIVVYGDLACPWATCAVARLHRARQALGLAEEVRFDHRAFPLELVNARPTPKPTLDAEIPAVGAIEPGFGFQVWTAPEWAWPGSVLLALEAVQAAKSQGLAASEQVDLALRRAMFAESACISLRSVVLDVAATCDAIDMGALTTALDRGDGRRAVLDQWRAIDRSGVKGSPHLFLPDGTSSHNPGIRLHWEGTPGEGGFPVVDADDPSVYEDLVRRAAPATAGAR